MDLAPLIGAGGGLGVLAFVIIYLLNSNRADRKDYREAIKEERTARRAAEERAALAERQLTRCRSEHPDGPR